MPITPSGLKKLRKPLDFDYYGNAVHIEYTFGGLNSDVLERWNGLIGQLNAAESEDEQRAALLAAMEPVCALLAVWDYCEEPETPDGPVGPMVPITPARLVEEFLRLPLFFPAFLQTVLIKIVEDATQGKVSGTALLAPSVATSSRAAKSMSSTVKRSPKRSKSPLSRAG